MGKIYLLLRSNRQLGPFTVEELLEHNLKPVDLIWVEGRSAGWSYPQEIEALKPFLKFETTSTPLFNPASQPMAEQAPKPPSKNVFVSLPDNVKHSSFSEQHSRSTEDDLEKKAEALRQRAQAYQATQPSTDFLQTNYSKDINDLEENYTGWFYEQSQKKKKEAKQKRKTFIIATVAIFVCGYALIQYFSSPDVKENSTVATAATTADISSGVTEPQPLPTSKQDLTNYEEPIPEQIRETASKPIKQNPVPASSLPSTKNEDPKPTGINNHTTEEPKAVYTKPQAEDIKPSETAQKPIEEKKKGLSKFLDKLKGKTKEETVTEDETAQRTTTNEKGERTAHRRSTNNPRQGNDDVAEISLDQIELKATELSNDWMIGVVGQKVTLTNKSPYIIETATVEVVYISEENSVLQKKNIIFSNIASKRSATLPVPDHRMAEKATYRLISATPKQDGIVKN